ncbi:MAG: hypothetical protein HN580_00640 [Deltaproteobacteria bacterium]|jgi:epoxyqueuosine reductase|nr:hypothetical protein [Deltaproteobacteria bacterium]MBT4091248.1 hypothetical protein [Deltaproteobacteria bacterium]MBT4265143.1 hypothetical protein [Deltaproteobacteria bacterium]MBT4641429.1 hypothetical protein [Deltaproteobacteria bacterium]MBT6500308.1 hypothetical protein [Deltaproteobacteria bacterium]
MHNSVKDFLETLFSENALNRLPDTHGSGRIFDSPLIGVSGGADPIFQRYKEVVGPEHLTPYEIWSQSNPEMSGTESGSLRVLSIIFPYTNRIREASKTAKTMPAEVYSVGRNFANEFMGDVLKKSVSFFQKKGYNAMAGMQSPVFQILTKEEPLQLYSVWSERHIAFAAGLGTFSLHEGFISEVGCNIRVTSVITDAPLEISPRKSDDPYANCLFYTTGKCKKCVERCPADALSDKGHDKLKCYLYLKTIEQEMKPRLSGLLKPHQRVVNGERNTSFPLGCAFCQFNVPCTSKIPVKERDEDNRD